MSLHNKERMSYTVNCKPTLLKYMLSAQLTSQVKYVYSMRYITCNKRIFNFLYDGVSRSRDVVFGYTTFESKAFYAKKV